MTGTTSTIKIYTGTVKTIKMVETRKTAIVIMKTRTISMGTIWIAIETISIDSNVETKATETADATKFKPTLTKIKDDSLLRDDD